MSRVNWAAAVGGTALASVLTASVSAAQNVTPFASGPNTQLQSGVTPYATYPAQPGVTSFGTSGLNSGVTSIRNNPQAEGTPVQARSFNQGGVATVPGGDTFTQSTNSTNTTSATSGRGFSNSRNRP